MSKDLVAKKFFTNNPQNFADILNARYQNTDIQGKDIKFVDVEGFYEYIEKNPVYSMKYKKLIRDLIAHTTIAIANDTFVTFTAMEFQSYVNYVMPLRMMGYDFVRYQMQYNEFIRDFDENGATRNEFLSRIRKGTKFIPIISYVLYLSPEPWDGSLTLSEMTGRDVSIYNGDFVDYRINLIAPYHMSDEEIGRYPGQIGAVLMFLKYCKDNEKLGEIVYNNDVYRSLSEDAYKLLCEYANFEFELNEEDQKDGRIDMCKAIDDIAMKNLNKGIQLGKVEGAEKALKKVVLNMHRQGCSSEMISRSTELSKTEVKKILHTVMN